MGEGNCGIAVFAIFWAIVQRSMSETTSSQCIFLEHSLTSASFVGKNVAQITLWHYTSRDIIRNKFVLRQISEIYCWGSHCTENWRFCSCSLCNNLLHKVKMNVLEIMLNLFIFLEYFHTNFQNVAKICLQIIHSINTCRIYITRNNRLNPF